MVDSVEETEGLENENTNKEPQSGKARASSTPGNPADHPRLVVIFPHFSAVDHILLHLQRAPNQFSHNQFKHA